LFTALKYTVAQQFATRYIYLTVAPISKTPEDQTLEYYRQNAKAYADRPIQSFELGAVQEFTKGWAPPFGRDPRHILDAGFGAGHHLALFLERGFRCDGFDGSEEMVTLAKQRLQKVPENQLKLWQADFRMVKLPKETYDGIWANRIFTHLPPQLCQRVMQSFFSALKKNGVLFASFEEPKEALPEGDQFSHHEEREGAFVKHYYGYPSHEFESLVRQSGFHPIAMGQDQNHPRRKAVLAKRI
jgi:SAM-dependent methyltransferase